jgi:hypothetical protein
MNLPIASLAKMFFASVTSFLLLCGSSPALGPNPQSSARTDKGLELRIHQTDEGEPGGPKFVVELHNRAETDLVLNLGEVFGEKQILNNIGLTVTDERGKSYKLVDSREPLFSINGSRYPLVVPLCIGCTFSFPVDFSKYHPLDGPMLNSGLYSIEAHFVGTHLSEVDRSVEVPPNWVGEATSNRLQFKISQ